MCCNDRTHVIVISSVWMVLTGISAIWSLIWTVGTYTSGASNLSVVNKTFGGHLGLVVGIQAVIHIIWITAEILSIVGAVKNKKWLLVPVMICLALQIVACIGVLTFYGSSRVYINPLLIVLGISFYFVSIAIRLHTELSYGMVSGVRPGMVLKSYTAPSYSALT